MINKKKILDELDTDLNCLKYDNILTLAIEFGLNDIIKEYEYYLPKYDADDGYDAMMKIATISDIIIKYLLNNKENNND